MSYFESSPVARLSPLVRAAYSVKEACAILGVSHPTLYKLIAQGRLRSVMAGRRRMIPASAIAEFLDS